MEQSIRRNNFCPTFGKKQEHTISPEDHALYRQLSLTRIGRKLFAFNQQINTVGTVLLNI